MTLDENGGIEVGDEVRSHRSWLMSRMSGVEMFKFMKDWFEGESEVVQEMLDKVFGEGEMPVLDIEDSNKLLDPVGKVVRGEDENGEDGEAVGVGLSVSWLDVDEDKFLRIIDFLELRSSDSLGWGKVLAADEMVACLLAVHDVGFDISEDKNVGVNWFVEEVLPCLSEEYIAGLPNSALRELGCLYLRNFVVDLILSKGSSKDFSSYCLKNLFVKDIKSNSLFAFRTYLMILVVTGRFSSVKQFLTEVVAFQGIGKISEILNDELFEGGNWENFTDDGGMNLDEWFDIDMEVFSSGLFEIVNLVDVDGLKGMFKSADGRCNIAVVGFLSESLGTEEIEFLGRKDMVEFRSIVSRSFWELNKSAEDLDRVCKLDNLDESIREMVLFIEENRLLARVSSLRGLVEILTERFEWFGGEEDFDYRKAEGWLLHHIIRLLSGDCVRDISRVLLIELGVFYVRDFVSGMVVCRRHGVSLDKIGLLLLDLIAMDIGPLWNFKIYLLLLTLKGDFDSVGEFLFRDVARSGIGCTYDILHKEIGLVADLNELFIEEVESPDRVVYGMGKTLLHWMVMAGIGLWGAGQVLGGGDEAGVNKNDGGRVVVGVKDVEW